MATSKGVIQGYTGVAPVDEKTKSSLTRKRMARVSSKRCCCRLPFRSQSQSTGRGTD
ncbi:MAG: hypothetical protein WAT12_16620 [Candidatus Nitrotoga sp.]